LKCDIRKFFANISHEVLNNILEKYIGDQDVLWLLSEVVDSFHTAGRKNFGLPLGNLTSQLFINIYMNEPDQFVKRKMKIRYYIRYANDFVILNSNREVLYKYTSILVVFLKNKLKLELNPNKISIKTLDSGVDFLGWIQFPNYRILRTSTKRRMFKKLKQNYKNSSADSYLGLLKHGDAFELSKDAFLLRKDKPRNLAKSVTVK